MKRFGWILAVALTASAQQQQQVQLKGNTPPDIHENGFIMLDVLEPFQFNGKDKNPKTIDPLISAEDKALVTELKLQQYQPNFKFNSVKPLDKEEPWLKDGLNVREKADAEKLSKILLAYVLEGWFEGLNVSAYDDQFRANNQRTWCNTPWLNVSEKGREAIHGLTKEFPISSSSVYSIPEEITKNESAVTWGSSFFNSKVCGAYKEFFKEPGMIAQARNRKPVFNAPNGAVSFKLLFNAMPEWNKHMPQWSGAYNWNAHLSNSRKSGVRKLMNVPLVQIDIGLRDSRIKGSDWLLKNWVMTSFYYDPTYTNETLADKNIPEPFKHMRPIGLQYGLDAGDSFIFEGSNNNHRPGVAQGDQREMPYERTRLNGPVDNPASSCLGCHAQSGMNAGLPNGQKVSGNGLGFLTKAEYLTWVGKIQGEGFDFNMQADKAFRNFAASKNWKINGPDPQK